MFNYQNDHGIRYVKNNTGADVDRFAILKIDGVEVTPTQNLVAWNNGQVLDGDTPAAGDLFCITQRSIKAGDNGPALVVGVSACKINVTDTSHQYAAAGTTVTELESGNSGARILWQESGTGTKNALVSLGSYSNFASYDVAEISLRDNETFTSADSGWNKLIHFSMTNLTNDYGLASPESDIYGRQSPTTSELILKQNGTYYGVVSFQMDITLEDVDQWQFRELTSTYTEPDTGNTTPIAIGGPVYFTEYDGYDIRFTLILTEVGNTTHADTYKRVGGSKYKEGSHLAPRLINGSETDPKEIERVVTMPFYFSLDEAEDDLPIELQCWMNIDTGDADKWQSASTQIIFAEKDDSLLLNGHTRGWIRHVPDISLFPTDPDLAETPP